MAFQLSDDDRKLSALDNANIRNPSPQNAAALNAELTRQQPSGGRPMTDSQRSFMGNLQRFSQGAVDFVTGRTPGGGAPEVIKTDIPNAVTTRFGQAQDRVRQFGDDNALGSPNVDFNAGRDYSINYLQRPDGTRAYTQEDSAPGLLGDSQKNAYGRNALEELAEAQRIRTETARANGPQALPGAGIVIPETNEQSDLDKRRAALQREFDNGSTAQDRNRAYRGLQLLNEQDRFETAADQSGQNAETYAQNQADIADKRAIAQTQQGRAARLASMAAAAKSLNELQRAGQQFTPIQTEAVKAAFAQYEQGAITPTQANAQLAQFGLPPLMIENNYEGGLIESYAGGGYIDPTMQQTQGTGAVGSAGAQGGNMQAMQRYTQYADKAREMNLPVMGYNEFAKMSTPEPERFAMGGMVEESVLGYAGGGTVDVSGEQVIDPDPNAPTDSIPAVIDGHRPAALDSGEFVIPKDVVMYYGTDKLTKMIDKARQPEGQNGGKQPTTALGGAPAG